MKPRPIVYCDIDEADSTIPERLARDCDVRMERLPVGDYRVSGAFAIERKSARDLVDSICSGRLDHQLHRLSATYKYAVLLIEGDSWEGDLRLKAPMLGDLYHRMSLASNLSCIYSPAPNYSARLIKTLATREQSRAVATIAHAPRPPVEKARDAIDVLRSFPGIGDARARKLIERFGSLRAVLLASKEELQAALGEKLGGQIHAVLS